MKIRISKFITYILSFIVILITMFFLLGNFSHTNLNQTSQTTINSTDKQYISLEQIDHNDSVMIDNIDITNSLLLPDNKVFFGGSKGYWSVETIINGESSGDNVMGKVGKWANASSITVSEISDDFETSSEILVGTGSGYIALINLETKEATFPGGQEADGNPLLTGKVIKIKSLGGHEYLLYDENGKIFKLNTSSNECSQVGDIFGEEKNNNTLIYSITDSYGSTDGSVMIGTYNYFYEYNFSEKTLKTFSLEADINIFSIMMLNSTECFLGGENGKWWNWDISSDTKISRGGIDDESGLFYIKSVIKIPRISDNEVLITSSKGRWAIISVDEGKDWPDVISSGSFVGKKNINSCILLDNGIALASGDGGRWASANFIGSFPEFDRDNKPEVTSTSYNSIEYQVTMKSDYPDWPMNVEKYRISSNFLNETTQELEYSTSSIYDRAGVITVKVDSLSSDTKYKDLRIKMVEPDGKTRIGPEWDTGIDFNTSVGRVTDINELTFDEESINSNGFEFTINSFECTTEDLENIEAYNIIVTSQKVDGVVGEQTIWTSSEQTTAKEDTKFTVENLNPGTKYEQVNAQIIYDDEGPVGYPIIISSEIITKNIPNKITAKIGEKSKESCEIILDIEAEDSTKEITDGYYMHVTDDNNLNFTSEKRFEAGKDVKFVVLNLVPGETYRNVKVFLSWDEEGKDPIEGCSFLLGDLEIENHVNIINTASFNLEELSSNSMEINVNVSSDNDSKDITTPFKIQVFDTLTSTTTPLYVSNEYQTSGDLAPIDISDLTMKTKYIIELQLIEGTKTIGQLFNLGPITTTSSKVTGMDNINILDNQITQHGFKVNINIKSDDESENVERYKLIFYNGETPIWTKESSKAGEQLFTITGLNSSTTYTNNRYELWDLKSDKKVDTKDGPDVTTLGIVKGFSGTPVESNITDKSFDLSLNIEDTFSKYEESSNGNKVVSYWILVFANNDYDNPIYKSKEGINFSGKVNITVDNLKSFTKFLNIEVQLVNEDGISFFGNPQDTGISIMTKMKTWVIIVISVSSIVFIILIIFTILFTIHTFKEKKEKEQTMTMRNMRDVKKW